jgi:hypothetical protein
MSELRAHGRRELMAAAHSTIVVAAQFESLFAAREGQGGRLGTANGLSVP